MKRMSIALTLCACVATQVRAADPMFMPFAVQVQRAANATLCETYRGDRSPLGLAVAKQCTQRANAEFASMADQKSLKDCIKPGNVIDDDVRKCMKGF